MTVIVLRPKFSRELREKFESMGISGWHIAGVFLGEGPEWLNDIKRARRWPYPQPSAVPDAVSKRAFGMAV
jgi:hypothetical protein